MEKEEARYRVEPLGSRAKPRPQAAVAATRRAAAILVVHGMGQQIQFQTLDDVAAGLQSLPGQPGGQDKPFARTVMSGTERLSRLELQVTPESGGPPRDVHIYEAYWAPLTEGRVTLRDVMRFLFQSGLGGIQSGWQPFRRWMFNDFVEFPAAVRTVLYLTIALAVAASLVWINTVIVALAAARAPLTSPPAWMSLALFDDITSVLNGLVLIYMAFALSVAAGMQRRVGWLRRAAGLPSVAALAASLWATMLAAAAMAVIVASHMRAAGRSVFETAGLAAPAARLNDWTNLAIVVVFGAIVIVRVAYWARTALPRLIDGMTGRSDAPALTALAIITVTAMLGSTAWLGLWLLDRAVGLPHVAQVAQARIAWPLTVVAAALVRSFLVEYVGDVVAYVQSQTLDRFNELRQRIKDLVLRKARAVYRLPEYDDVILVGHSLGSVLIYDVLNRLLTEEAERIPDAPVVKSRTRLLLTFGSPLDKTAFLFGAQGTGSEAREALAASVQPLITDQDCRPEWINVFSRWDVISGPLTYYDLPDRSNRRPVINAADPDATALLGAHVEYWQNPLIFREIVRRLA